MNRRPPVYLTGLLPDLHALAREALIDLVPDARQSRDAAKEYDEQEEFAATIEKTVLQSTAELVDFVEADSLAAAASAAMEAAG